MTLTSRRCPVGASWRASTCSLSGWRGCRAGTFSSWDFPHREPSGAPASAPQTKRIGCRRADGGSCMAAQHDGLPQAREARGSGRIPCDFVPTGLPAPGGARRLALDPLALDPLVLGTTLGAPAPESSAQSLPGRRDLLAESLGEALSEARSERARETDRKSTRLNFRHYCAYRMPSSA